MVSYISRIIEKTGTKSPHKAVPVSLTNTRKDCAFVPDRIYDNHSNRRLQQFFSKNLRWIPISLAASYDQVQVRTMWRTDLLWSLWETSQNSGIVSLIIHPACQMQLLRQDARPDPIAHRSLFPNPPRGSAGHLKAQCRGKTDKSGHGTELPDRWEPREARHPTL